MSAENEQKAIDIPTVIAISTVTWITFNELHTVIGHGSACLLRGYGSQVQAISTTLAYCTGKDVPTWGEKLYFAGGHIVNFIAAGIFLLLLRLVRSGSPTIRLFLWLSLCFNLFNVGNAILGTTIYGDWAEFVYGLEPSLLWKIVLTLVGIGIIKLGFFLASRYWEPFLGGNKTGRLTRMRILTILPFVTAFVVSVTAGLMSPLQFEPGILQSILAPLSLFWLLLLPLWSRNFQTQMSIQALPIKRSAFWLAVGVIAVILYIEVQGPGLGDFPEFLLR